MELSLQSRKDYKSMRLIRKMMITKEKLHINDKIDYERFLELYKKYGNSVDEKDFAKYVLDIPYHKHYCLQCGKTKITPILSREYVTSKEIEEIKKYVMSDINYFGFSHVNYEIVEDLYNRYAGRLSMFMFAEEILGISTHSIECMKSDREKETRLFNQSLINRADIRKRQNEIIVGEKLHIDDTITKVQFYELYAKYGIGISEREFATRVLQILSSRYNRLISGRNAYTTILSTYIYNPESVYKLRERVIKKENLRIDDLIDYSKFQELHRKYGGPLSEELFAEEVLDITAVGVKNMRVAGSLSAILTDIEVPEEYTLELREKVANENSLRQDQGLTLSEIDALYQNYGGVLSRKMFAIDVLDITYDAYNSLVCGANKTTSILRSHNPSRFIALRRKVIFENDLKINGLINYQTAKRYYEQYGSNECETIFAEKVLGIPQKIFYNLKYGASKQVNVLQDEPLPTDEECYGQKIKIGLEFGLHIKDKINYATFSKIYNRFGGMLTEEDFAEKILDISKATLRKIKNDSEKEVLVFGNTEIPEEEIKKLRRQVILDNNIYPERSISLKFFKKIYSSHEHILSETRFAELVLGINKQCINKLKSGAYDTVKALLDMKKTYSKRSQYFSNEEEALLKEALIQGLSEEAIATRLFVKMELLKRNLDMLHRYGRLSAAEIEAERIARQIDTTALKVRESKTGDTKKKEEKEKKRRLKEAEILRKKKDRVLDDFELTEKDINIMKSYIQNCRERFAHDEFFEIELPELEESIGFIEGDARDIRFFARVCTAFGLYKKASVFISNNIDNQGITKEEKATLKTIQSSINYANRRQNAVNMISNGFKDAKVISVQTGIAEVDVLEMKRRMGLGEEIDLNKFLDKSLDEE